MSWIGPYPMYDTSKHLKVNHFNIMASFYAWSWTTEALDGRAVLKILKRHFFQDIKNSFHGVTQICLKPHQIFFQIFFSTNIVPRGAQSFLILEGATELLIEL